MAIDKLLALLLQSDAAAQKSVSGSADGLAKKVANVTLEASGQGSNGVSSDDVASETTDSEAAASMGGSFLETLTSSDFYKKTKVAYDEKSDQYLFNLIMWDLYIFERIILCLNLCVLIQVRDILGSFRWAPFLALQKSDSFLTMLLLLSKYRMKSLPVVDLGDGKIDNIITQSAVVHMLAECVGLHWFEDWGTKKLFELGLPIMKPSRLVKVIFLLQLSFHILYFKFLHPLPLDYPSSICQIDFVNEVCC